jgi:ankyrin repeat protein
MSRNTTRGDDRDNGNVIAAALKWAVAVAKIAPHNIKAKRLGRELLACPSFMQAVQAKQSFTYDADFADFPSGLLFTAPPRNERTKHVFCRDEGPAFDAIDQGWHFGSPWVIFQRDLHRALEALARDMSVANTALKLGDELGMKAVGPCVLYHPRYPFGTARSAVRQDAAMPILAAQLDFMDQTCRPEDIYIHLQLLLAAAIDPFFGELVHSIASDLSIMNSCPANQATDDAKDAKDDVALVVVHNAPIKSFSRMSGKMACSDDHRYEAKPRPGLNIDIVRRLAVTTTAAAARELVRRVTYAVGGASYIKCLPDLIEADTTQAKARYHMLPVMVTLPFDAGGRTVADLVALPSSKSSWAKLRANVPGSVHEEQWVRDHDRAAAILSGVSANPAVLSEPAVTHCEVQVLVRDCADIRHDMHELYKLKRADTALLLLKDVTPTAVLPTDLTSTVAHGTASTLAVPPTVEIVAAVREGMVTSVQTFLLRSCDSEKLDPNHEQWTDADGKTLLYVAAERGHLGVVLLLLDAGSCPDIQVSIKGEATIDFAIHIAATRGHVDVVAALIRANADPNVVDVRCDRKRGHTAAMIAAEHGNADVVAALLDGKADPNYVTTTWDRNEEQNLPHDSALWRAIKKSHLRVLNVLLEAKADPNVVMVDKATALSRASANGDLGIVKSLLQYSANPNYVTRRGILNNAIKGNHVCIIKELLAANADPNIMSTYMLAEPPLTVAVTGGHMDAAVALLEANADPNLPSTIGPITMEMQTPMYHAADHGLVEMLTILLANGGDPNNGSACLAQINTLLCAASRKGHTECVALLRVELHSSRCHWVPDVDAPECMRCSKRFSLFVRRHHCRSCGLVICHVCSSSMGPFRECWVCVGLV